MLSIWLLLWISHSSIIIYLWFRYVVNCFQFDYFCGYHTAARLSIVTSSPLWIAFNLITFVDITQLSHSTAKCADSCELLSIWLLLWISHSAPSVDKISSRVVNCFQFDYFCGYHTAFFTVSWIRRALWIAFNLITFVDITQQFLFGRIWVIRCELLSIWLLLWISHS